MKSTRTIINIDLDNVVYDFVGAMQGYAEFILGRKLPEWTEWDVWTQWGIPRGAFDFLFRRGVEEDFIWRHGNVIPGAIEALWALSDNEYHIRLVTTRLTSKFGHDKAVSHTVEWLKENAIPYRSLAFIGYGDAKTNYDAIALVDDNVENLTEWGARYETAIAYSQPWNRDLVTGRHLQISRADSWAEVIKEIERLPR